MKRLWIPALAALAMAALTMPSAAFGAGDVPGRRGKRRRHSTRAILWTRVAGLTTPEQIKVEGWTNSSLSGPKAFKGKFKPTAARDWTVKIDVTGLQPGHAVLVPFKKDADASDVGTFRTAPAANTSSDVEFTWTGDSDAFKVSGVNPFNNWETLAARAERERRLLRLPRRHDLLGLEQPSGRSGHDAGRVPRRRTSCSARTRT